MIQKRVLALHESLVLIEDGFITYLFDIIEGLSDDVSDPYHYPVIKVLVSIL